MSFYSSRSYYSPQYQDPYLRRTRSFTSLPHSSDKEYLSQLKSQKDLLERNIRIEKANRKREKEEEKRVERAEREKRLQEERRLRELEKERERRRTSSMSSGRSSSLSGYGSSYGSYGGFSGRRNSLGSYGSSPSSSYSSYSSISDPRQRRYSNPSISSVTSSPASAYSYKSSSKYHPDSSFHLSSKPHGPPGSRIVSRLGRISASSSLRTYPTTYGGRTRESGEEQRERLMNRLITTAKSRGGNGVIGIRLGRNDGGGIWAEGDVVTLDRW